MSEALDRLKDIGAQKIYEDTYIPVEHVQEILYESFEGLNKLQFIGFISILEREYGEDLSATRARGIGYFDEKNEADKKITSGTIFQSSGNRKNFTIVYILLAITLFAVALFFYTQSANTILNKTNQENKVVADVKKNIVVDINVSENNNSDINSSLNENNSSDDTNISLQEDSNITALTPTIQKATPMQSLKIIAKKRVWLGYVDVVTNKKYQKTFQGELDLDPTKEWLFYFGHGYINVVVNKKEIKFHDKNTLRLHYDDGKIEKISIKEFRRLNRGSAW